MTDKELFRRLNQALVDEKVETPDPGFFTSKQWAQKFGCSKTNVNRLIAKLQELGMVESKFFRVRDARKIHPYQHYKFKGV